MIVQRRPALIQQVAQPTEARGEFGRIIAFQPLEEAGLSAQPLIQH